jgi:hypothetical protein
LDRSKYQYDDDDDFLEPLEVFIREAQTAELDHGKIICDFVN